MHVTCSPSQTVSLEPSSFKNTFFCLIDSFMHLYKQYSSLSSPSLSHGHPSDQVSLLLFTSSLCVWNTEYSKSSFPEHGEGLFSIKVNLLVTIPLEKVPSPHPWVLLWAFLLPKALSLTQNLSRGQWNSGLQILAGSWTLDLSHRTVVMGLDEKNMLTATVGQCKNWTVDGWAVAQR